MGFLIDWLTAFWDFFIDTISWLVFTLFELLLIALAAILNAIPVPAWLVSADPFANLHPGVVFFAEAFEIPAGIGILLGAYTIRFIIRRIPVIG